MIPTYSWDDPEDRFWAGDKADHALGGALVGSWAFVVGAPGAYAVGVALIAGAAVELFEVWRYERWRAKDSPQPWPWLCDKWSWKDLLVDGMAGWCGWRIAVFLGGLA